MYCVMCMWWDVNFFFFVCFMATDYVYYVMTKGGAGCDVMTLLEEAKLVTWNMQIFHITRPSLDFPQHPPLP